MFIAGELCDFSDASNAETTTTTTTTTTTLLGATTVVRMRYSSAACWAFRFAPPPPSPLISTSIPPETPQVLKMQHGPSNFSTSLPPRQVLNSVSVTGEPASRVDEVKSQQSEATVVTQGNTGSGSGSADSAPLSVAVPSVAGPPGTPGPESSDAAPASALCQVIAPLMPRAPVFPTGEFRSPRPGFGVPLVELRLAALGNKEIQQKAGKSSRADNFLKAMKCGPAQYTDNREVDERVRKETTDRWQAKLKTMGGTRRFYRVWHSVTPDNLEDFDILREAKPERLPMDQIAAGEVKKMVPWSNGKSFYRRTTIEIPFLQTAYYATMDFYIERNRAGTLLLLRPSGFGLSVDFEYHIALVVLNQSPGLSDPFPLTMFLISGSQSLVVGAFLFPALVSSRHSPPRAQPRYLFRCVAQWLPAQE
ncbi:hypothetical protein MP228_011513 [Amoeboaphelidium protococcarum]|nr:hypothetical protein MP228_011513 [Amoeboaphelidium protococcarum]